MKNLRLDLIDQEIRALCAYKNRDIEFCQYYLADDILNVTSFSVFDKETALRGIATNSSQVLGYAMESPRRTSSSSALRTPSLQWRSSFDTMKWEASPDP